MWKERGCWKMSVFIANFCHGVGSKNGGRNWSGGRSFEHWPRGSPGQRVPETDFLRASAIFVSGTRGITATLKYRRVSPIVYLSISLYIYTCAKLMIWIVFCLYIYIYIYIYILKQKHTYIYIYIYSHGKMWWVNCCYFISISHMIFVSDYIYIYIYIYIHTPWKNLIIYR